ncbi:hypothetical protein WJX73_010039 [Symbiochloris irregularis]|uniref:Ran-binding protein 10 n=1 Tax=Symbiochloris irregularis TaxID=706552 RepID=A0AAW1NST5_9CHLO
MFPRVSTRSWHWQPSASNDNSRFLRISGLSVKYVGPGDTDADAACVRTTDPAESGLFYFEVDVVNKGRDGFIGIGFVSHDFDKGRLPGWEPHTFGYHGDDGKAFHNSSSGIPYGPKFGTGDRLGVMFNRAERTIAYTKNGIYLGIAFRNVQDDVLYPAVGLRTPDEEVLANFGAVPFKADVSAMKAEAAYVIEQQIRSMPLPVDKTGGSTATLGHIIFSHLAQHGHWGSAAAVARDMLGETVAVPPSTVQDFEARLRVRGAIVGGDMDGALAAAEAFQPGALAACPHLLQRVKCQKFVELVRVRDDQAALAYGKAELGSAADLGPEQAELLSDILTLLCYEDPANSPQGTLLQPAARAALADDVDAALLKARQLPQHSPLERLYCILKAMQSELEREQHPAASLVDLDRLLGLPS